MTSKTEQMSRQLIYLLVAVICLINDLTVAIEPFGSRGGRGQGLILVNTPVGDIEGRSKDVTLPDGTNHSLDFFLGIPFAEPPVGNLRFMKPVKKAQLGYIFRAHNESKACPQSSFILKQWVPGPEDMSEDCLKLNIYVPTSNNDRSCDNYAIRPGGVRCTPKPVMVWIHGGAFLIGQSRIYNGERLAVFGDVIVVTINYRLGPLGFLSTGDGVVRGNAGLWDQAEAISWVYDNIGSFGGDSKKITVFGESAGASSAVFQAMYPGNIGKISRIIASSGTPLCPWTFSKEPTAKYTLRLAKRLGCASHDHPGFSVAMHQKMMACLQTKSYREIIENSFVGDLNETLFRPEFVPIVDGDFITSLPTDDLTWTQPLLSSSMLNQRLKALSHVDALFGNNYNDGEAIAKISVRMYINETAGLDFDDDLLTQSIVEKHYVPKLIEDFALGQTKFTNMYKNSIASKMHSVYYNDNLAVQTMSSDINPIPSQRDLALDMILDMTTDVEFLMPTIRTISSIKPTPSLLQSQSPSSSSGGHFLFLFDRKYPYKSTFDWIKHASHGDDLPYIFGFPRSMNLAFGVTDDIERAEWGTSEVIMTYWTNFAKTGDPNTPRQVPTRWEMFDPRYLNYLYLTENMSRTSARQKLFEDRVNLWKDISQELDIK